MRTKSITILYKLYESVRDIAQDYNLKVHEYIIKCLREVTAEYNATNDGFEISKEERETIKKRLRDLGYLD
jgi:hypothetical protein